MTTPPHDGGNRDDSTQWSWDNVPQVDPSRTPPPPTNDAGYGERRFSGPQQGGGYAPIPVGGQFGDVRPGIIPLRPLKLGEFFDGGFSAIRFNPGVMLGMAAIVIFTSLIIEFAINATLLQTFNQIVESDTGNMPALSDREVLSFVITVLGASLVSFIASTILTGLLIQCVTQSILGRKVSLGQVWKEAKGRILPLFGLTLLIAVLVIVVMIAMAIVAGIVLFGLGASFSPDSGVGAFLLVIIVILTMIGGALGVFWIYVKTSLATPVLMAEKAGVMTALRRSFSLTRGYFWRIAGILFLTIVLVGIMVGIVSSLFSGILTFGLTTAGTSDNPMDLMSWSSIISSVITSLLQLVFTPFLAAVITLVYTDTRMRKEGLDLLLQRAANRSA